MRRLFSDMNPTLRGFLIIGLIALVVVLLQLQRTLVSLGSCSGSSSSSRSPP